MNRVARARRLLRQLVVDPIVGLAGGIGIYRSPSADDRARWAGQRLDEAIRRGFEEGAADYARWKADNPIAAAKWEADLARIDAAQHRGR